MNAVAGTASRVTLNHRGRTDASLHTQTGVTVTVAKDHYGPFASFGFATASHASHVGTLTAADLRAIADACNAIAAEMEG